MRVALATTTFPVPKPGRDVGVERLARALAEGLMTRGFDVTIVTTFWNGGNANDSFGSADVLRVPDTSRFLGKWAALGDSHYWTWGSGLVRTLQGIRPDLIHSLAPLSSTPELIRAGLPVLTTFHHPEQIWRWRELANKPIHKILEYRAYRASTLVITPSHASAAALVNTFGIDESRVRVVPWGVDSNQFRPRLPQESREPIVLYVGLHEPRKGITHLLEAVARLRRECVPVRLVTVGGGPQLPELRRRALELGIGNYVTFLGYVPDLNDETLPRIYSEADVFVLPSLREGFGFVLLEAMASGLPVVASDISSIPEVVGDAGVLFPAGDAIVLAEAIRMLITNPDRRRELALKARRRVEMYFTWDRTMSLIVSAYQEAMQLAGRRSSGLTNPP